MISPKTAVSTKTVATGCCISDLLSYLRCFYTYPSSSCNAHLQPPQKLIFWEFWSEILRSSFLVPLLFRHLQVTTGLTQICDSTSNQFTKFECSEASRSLGQFLCGLSKTTSPVCFGYSTAVCKQAHWSLISLIIHVRLNITNAFKSDKWDGYTKIFVDHCLFESTLFRALW